MKSSVKASLQQEAAERQIEEITKLYLEAKDEQRRCESLVAVAAHELRHPLHLMRLALARYFPNPTDRGREVLERYIDRMSRVIGDLTDFVRIEQDDLALQLSWVDITQALRDVVDAYIPDAAARLVKLTLEGFTSPVWI